MGWSILMSLTFILSSWYGIEGCRVIFRQKLFSVVRRLCVFPWPVTQRLSLWNVGNWTESQSECTFCAEVWLNCISGTKGPNWGEREILRWTEVMDGLDGEAENMNWLFRETDEVLKVNQIERILWHIRKRDRWRVRHGADGEMNFWDKKWENVGEYVLRCGTRVFGMHLACVDREH